MTDDLEIRSVRFARFVEQSTLESPPLTVPRGSLILLRGPNGSGKTSLLDSFRESPEALMIDGAPASRLLLEQDYRRLLFPYQPVWWNISVPVLAANAIGNKAAARRLAREQLSRFNLQKDIELDEYPLELSGGEQHLVMICRVAVCDHAVLLLDEPTTGIDQVNIPVFWGLVKELLRRNHVVILTTHEALPPHQIVNEVTFAGVDDKSLRLAVVKL